MRDARFVRWLLIFALAASTAFAAEQIRFAPPARYAAGTQPKSIAVGDLNGDGMLDIVAGSPTDQKVYVLLGNGDGTFQAAVAYATANASPMAVMLADFTGDGKPDIAVVTANWGGSYPAAMVLPGNGAGTFGAPIVTPVVVSPMSAMAVDVDGDGKQDLVIGANSSAAVAYGNGDGTFREFVLPPPSGTGDVQWAASAADLNGDGFVDIFTGSYGGYIAVYLANADASFQTPVNIAALDPGYHGVSSVAARDLNGDGFPDIVGVSSNGNASVLLLNSGHRTFSVAESGFGGSTPTGIAFADFNGDGKVEVAFSDYNNGTSYAPADNYGVTVVTGGGSNGSLLTYFTQFDAGNHAGGIAVGDFNGDGLPDVVTADAQDNAVSVLLNGAAMMVTASATPNPALPGQSVTFSATVAAAKAGGPTPTGTLTFLQNDQLMGSVNLDAGGRASISRSFTLPASGAIGATIYALYSGDPNYFGSSDTSLFFQVGYPTTTTLTATPAGTLKVGGSTTLTASVSSGYGSPTGWVRFCDSDTLLTNVPLTGGTASYVVATLTAGSHTFNAFYVRNGSAGTAGLLSSNASVTVVAGIPTTTTLSSPTSAKPGDSVTLKASVTGAGAAGTVIFSDGSSALGSSALVNGSATLSATLALGTHAISAAYQGNADYQGSTSASATVAVQYATSISLSVPASVTAGASLVLNATVTAARGSPGGTVTFKDGSTVLATVAVASAAASKTIPNVSAGVHSFTASYSGDASYSSSSTMAATVTSVAEDFAVTVPAQSPVTIAAGKPATVTISVAPQPGGFASTVQFSCSGLPALAGCSFSPATVSPGTAAATTTMTISTTAPSSRSGAALGFFLWPSLLPLGAVVVGGYGVNRRKRYLLALMLMLIVAVAMIACGGGNSTAPVIKPGTPPGTYTVTVLAQSGQTTHSTTLTLIVQ